MEELSASEHHAREAVATHCSDIGMDTSVYCAMKTVMGFICKCTSYMFHFYFLTLGCNAYSSEKNS
jgi:hypothetical protein